jgi:hypothetical protein
MAERSYIEQREGIYRCKKVPVVEYQMTLNLWQFVEGRRDQNT